MCLYVLINCMFLSMYIKLCDIWGVVVFLLVCACACAFDYVSVWESICVYIYMRLCVCDARALYFIYLYISAWLGDAYNCICLFVQMFACGLAFLLMWVNGWTYVKSKFLLTLFSFPTTNLWCVNKHVLACTALHKNDCIKVRTF